MDLARVRSRAGEVLATIEDFATMKDPRGGLLIDRTVVICNTSSMPVAAREGWPP